MRKQNSYKTLSSGHVFANGVGMVYSSKTSVCQAILRLTAAQISAFFDGVQGKPYIEGIRHAMIDELNGWVHPISSWREIAQIVKERDSSDYIH